MILEHINSVKRVLKTHFKSPYPTQYLFSSAAVDSNDDDVTVVTSNSSSRRPAVDHHALGMMINSSHAIADTGATSLFLTKGAPCLNKRRTQTPISVTLPDGRKITSSHVCDIRIPGLPTVLTGHIMPDMTTASLFGIRILCKAGCKVVFDDEKCQVFYKNNIILTGFKDPASDLWTLPIVPDDSPRTTLDATRQSSPGPCLSDAPSEFASFSYHRTTQENNVKFMHQSLCNPPKSSLLTAIRRGFLRGAPHLNLRSVAKYLPPSMATAKGHLKRPRKGIRSTTPRTPRITVPASVPDRLMPGLDELADDASDDDVSNAPHFNIIDDVDDHSIANVFCFGAFADKITGVVYNDCTGEFPYTSLDGNVCFFVMYHYETNAILATPIPGLSSDNILSAYKKNFEYLVSKGFKPKLNVMDNQATKVIKAYLTPREVALQLVEPHNHRVNAAERAIQTFKNRFVGALGTTDADFPIQLWDKLTPQVQDSINLLRQSRVNPAISAYEVLEGPYDWNRYPIAPLGTKAIIYEDSDTRASWAPHGLDAWLLGPSKDHYRCHLYFVPETSGYRVSGSAELFPQHCVSPPYSHETHINELASEMTSTIPKLSRRARTIDTLRTLAQHLDAYVSGAPLPLPPPITVLPPEEQRVPPLPQPEEQRVIAPLRPATSTPATIAANDPTGKRALRTTKRTHKRTTRANTPGRLPSIVRTNMPRPLPIFQIEPEMPLTFTTPVAPRPTLSRATPRRSGRLNSNHLPDFRNVSFISQEAINFLVDANPITPEPFVPLHLRDSYTARDIALYGFAMVHPVTGEHITSYRKLMNDPVTSEVWMTAFGKDFGGMCQGDLKTGTKGTDAIFVMEPRDVPNIPKDQPPTYAKVVVAYRPQKDDPYRIRITAGGNKIYYPGELTTRTADMTTAKLHWNSVLSTPGAKYMCLDIGNFYLSATLDRYEYMKMPISLFPPWIVKQYDLSNKVVNGFVYLQMRKAVWGLPQAGILANKLLRKRLAPHGYYECKHTPGLWKHKTRPISFTLVVDDFGIKYTRKEDVDHLIAAIKEKYKKLSEDWSGDLYCGIKLTWDYDARTLDISMPGYVQKQLQRYKHALPLKRQNCPFSPQPKQYGSEAQRPIEPDTSPPLSEDEKKQVQRVVGSILYYARAVDLTVLMALSTIASEQSKGTQQTMQRCKQLLDYLATHPDATVRFHASDMILNIHSDASYLSEKNAHSRACGHFFMGWKPDPTKPIKLNGAFFTLCSILRFVVASAAEAELGALFLNCKQAAIFRVTLEEMGHPQPPIPVNCDNSTAVGIANNTVKRQRSRAMEMRFFWVADAVEQGKYDIKYFPGKENLADYQSKHHSGAHHIAVRPWYLHENTSVRELPRACKPSTLKGCVGTLPDGYVRTNPLPQVPSRQSAPITAAHLPTYFRLPVVIPTLRRLLGPAIARVRIPS